MLNKYLRHYCRFELTKILIYGFKKKMITQGYGDVWQRRRSNSIGISGIYGGAGGGVTAALTMAGYQVEVRVAVPLASEGWGYGWRWRWRWRRRCGGGGGDVAVAVAVVAPQGPSYY